MVCVPLACVRFPRARARGSAVWSERAGVGIRAVGERRAIEAQRSGHVGGIGRDVVGEHHGRGRARADGVDLHAVRDPRARNRAIAAELVEHRLRLVGSDVTPATR